MATFPQTGRVIRFGPFEVDLQNGELRKGGVKVRIQEQPFRLLTILLEKPGETVTREELQQRLWPADTFVDFDHSLNAAVKKVRSALDDDPETPRFVETVPRRGYRFIYPVGNFPTNSKVKDVKAEGIQKEAAPSAARERFPVRSRLLVVGFGVAVLLVALALLAANVGGLRDRLRPNRGAAIRSIAVLPLVNLSGDPSQEYFADGMTDALITGLSKVGSLTVISRTSVMQYKGAHRRLPDIARELNVDAVVEGSVLRSGNRVRIAAQLIHAPTDRHLWAENFERDFADILKLQSEVAQAIAHQVWARLTPQQQSTFGSARAVNPAAYEAYLKGRFYQVNSSATPQAIRRAQSQFELAVQNDPDFALAYVGLADCYEKLGEFRWVARRDAYQPARDALEKALKLDQTSGEAHSRLGNLIWLYEWDWPNAEREFKQALELNPSDTDGHALMALFRAWSGQHNEAFAEVARIRELSPSWTFDITSAINYHLRDYQAMVDFGRRVVPSNPESWLGHYWLAVGYEGTGQPAEAIAEYQKAVELSQGDTDPTAGLAHAFVATGQKDKAEQILRELLQKSKTSYVSPYMIATIYAGLGEEERAFEFLEKAYQEQSPDVAYFIKADLRIDSLRSDERFKDLVRRIGLPQ